jgi:GNAT superfamily N-acetyltransferase
MESRNLYIELVDLNDNIHCWNLLCLLNDYMEDEMGCSNSMSPELADKIIHGLKNYPCYLGYFVKMEEKFIGLANCNKSFSSFMAAPLLNIHDFIIDKEYRGRGAGTFLMGKIIEFAIKKDYCMVNLEVRKDNIKAQGLYRKTGFGECDFPMFFWERKQ